jgi:hypothetical protein
LPSHDYTKRCARCGTRSADVGTRPLRCEAVMDGDHGAQHCTVQSNQEGERHQMALSPQREVTQAHSMSACSRFRRGIAKQCHTATNSSRGPRTLAGYTLGFNPREVVLGAQARNTDASPDLLSGGVPLEADVTSASNSQPMPRRVSTAMRLCASARESVNMDCALRRFGVRVRRRRTEAHLQDTVSTECFSSGRACHE